MLKWDIASFYHFCCLVFVFSSCFCLFFFRGVGSRGLELVYLDLILCVGKGGGGGGEEREGN